ncbi:MAG: GNAT family N-acetyltransferase, partial [Nitrospiraceae bacterium]
SESEVREAQRLRYRVFVEECGARISSPGESLDQDLFDSYCDHLLVRDGRTDEVVGTYRILPASQARKVGGFYSETEFDLTKLRPLFPKLAEVGRSCIHPDYRRGGVISLLWSGLAQYMMEKNYEFLMGCASINLADGGTTATEVYVSLSKKCLSPDAWRVFPLCPFPMRPMCLIGQPMLPPLVKGYVRLGAYVCGEPAWDRQFNTADLLMLLPIARMDQRYARHFMGNGCQALSQAA